MFRFGFICDDKHLARIMHSLTGITMNLEVQSVVNGKQVDGGVKAKTPGDVVSLFVDYLREKKLKTFIATDVQAFQSSVGRSPTGYSGTIKALEVAGILRKHKRGKGNTGFEYTLTGVHVPKQRKKRAKKASANGGSN